MEKEIKGFVRDLVSLEKKPVRGLLVVEWVVMAYLALTLLLILKIIYLFVWLISLYKYTINEREKPSITVIYFLCSHWNFLYPLHFAAGIFGLRRIMSYF